MSSLSSVLTIWTCNDLRRVAVRYNEPRGRAVQVWKGNHPLLDKPCADAAEVAAEADHLLDACCPPWEGTVLDPPALSYPLRPRGLPVLGVWSLCERGTCRAQYRATG